LLDLFRDVVLVTWLAAYGYFGLMAAGLLANASKGSVKGRRTKIAEDDPLFLQITTIGNDTVDAIIQRIHSYRLSFPHEIWVVKEPEDPRRYQGADRVVTVPRDFKVVARFKARALEYARLLRGRMVASGELVDDYRVMYLDDDSIPTPEFIHDSWTLEFDVLEGVISNGNRYGTLKSYLDTIRTVSCLQVCALFQGLSRPVWIHGEALCVSSRVDREVPWDSPMMTSEDLIFGHTAMSKGFKMRFTYSKVNITSPLSFRDFLRQRRRWLWGNLRAVHQGLIPWSAQVKVMFFWAFGLVAYPIATAGILLGVQGLGLLTTASLVLWLLTWGISALFIRRSIVDALVGCIVSFPSATVNFFVTLFVLLLGPPRNFEVIAKAV
jgi:cellulose synthase/poly-beta-1,6-N-acetylglucosamine synthase-like glycosyltransferase